MGVTVIASHETDAETSVIVNTDEPTIVISPEFKLSLFENEDGLVRQVEPKFIAAKNAKSYEAELSESIRVADPTKSKLVPSNEL